MYIYIGRGVHFGSNLSIKHVSLKSTDKVPFKTFSLILFSCLTRFLKFSSMLYKDIHA